MQKPETRFESHSLKTALQIYSLYRLLQSAALLVLFFFGGKTGYLGKESPFLFFICASLYCIFCSISVIQTSFKKLPDIEGRGILFIFMVDVIAITSFIHFSGGIHSSLGILMVVVVATAGIFLQGRLALFIAALASLAILAEQIYLYAILKGSSDNFAATGILGLALFGAALIVQQLANRLRTSEQLLSVQSEQVQTLEQINQQIIERMPSGVIVVGKNLNLQFMNTAALQLLKISKLPEGAPLEQISSSLDKQVQAWLQNPNKKPEPFNDAIASKSLTANFAHLGSTDSDETSKKHSGTIIFLEDASLMSERAQKMKLASLGTLTAGIAHEIRNPLGAVSHAAQLLQESTTLSEDDRRLTEIIQQHSNRMNRIIENVLQLSRQRAGELEKIELAQWLKSFVKAFKSSKPFDMEFQLSLSENIDSIRADASQLTQVLTNLCENALRYSFQETGDYYVQLHCAFNEERYYHFIDIIDRGPGINKEQAEHIFEPFYTTDTKGSGLGLYIAKELCENNRSQLSYILGSNGGSCFRISFSE